MPPWMSREDSDDVPPPKSPLSTSAVRKPRSAASRAIAAPVMPPTITSTSTGSAAMASSAARRVRNENGVSTDNSRPSRGHGRFRACFPRVCRRSHPSGCDHREENVMPGVNGRLIAVIAGCRTPFCKSGTLLKDTRAVDLARFAARELLERTSLDPAEVDAVIFGQVVPSALVPNVAREVSLLPQFPREIPAYSLNRACASSAQAVANAHDEIALGKADVVLAGGVESLSDIPILASRRLADILVEASKVKTLAARVTDDGRITAEIAPWLPTRLDDPAVTTDNGIRRDTSLEQMAKLKPVFDRRYGTVTAANSSPLTDGASAVLLMSEEAA